MRGMLAIAASALMLAAGAALAADEPVLKLHVGKDQTWLDPSMPVEGTRGWDLGAGQRLDVTSRTAEDGVHLSLSLTALGKPGQRASMIVPFGGEGGMAFESGHRLRVSVGAPQDDGPVGNLVLNAAPEAVDIEALRGKLTDLKPNKTVITVNLPKLNAAQIEKFWAESGEPRPTDPDRLADRPYVQFLDNTPWQGRPGGRRSHIADGYSVDTFGSIRLGKGGSGKVFDSTNTFNNSTMQIGPEMLGGVRYTSFTRYDTDEPGYVTINRVIVVDGQATLIRGLKAKLGAMTTYALPGGHVASLMPVMRRVGEPDFRGQSIIPMEALQSVEILADGPGAPDQSITRGNFITR